MTGADVRDYFARKVEKTVTQYNINPGIKGAINGILKRACGGDDNRRLVLKYLCGVTSSKMLTAAQWMVLADMVGPAKPFDEWIANNPKFERSINAILYALGDQDAQEKMKLV